MVPLECRVRARPLFVTCDLPSSAAGGRDVDVEAVAGGLAVGHDLDLTGYEAYRVIERAARRSVTAGQFLGHQNALGPGALAQVIPSGPLQDPLRLGARMNTIGAFAVTEPGGFNNTIPATTETVTDDGSAFVLRGEKRFIGCGAIAGLLAISAGSPRNRPCRRDPRRVRRRRPASHRDGDVSGRERPGADLGDLSARCSGQRVR